MILVAAAAAAKALDGKPLRFLPAALLLAGLFALCLFGAWALGILTGNRRRAVKSDA